MKASSIRFWNLLGSLAILAAIIFVFSFFLVPAYKEVNQLRGDLSSKSETLESQEKIVLQVKNLLDQYQGFSGPKQALSLILPTEEEYPALLNQINGLAKAAGLLLESANTTLAPLPRSSGLNQKSGNPVVGVIRVNMSLKGPYSAVKSFLNTIETNIRIMDLVSLSINAGSGSDVNYSYNIVVNTYYQSL